MVPLPAARLLIQRLSCTNLHAGSRPGVIRSAIRGRHATHQPQRTRLLYASTDMLINRTSLSQTVDAVSAAQFDGRALTASDRTQVAGWIAARQGLPGAYGDTFAGFPAERSKGIVLF